MQFADNDFAAEVTERVMQALKRAEVLRPDLPNYPTHYNRAFSAVHGAIRPKANEEEALRLARENVDARMRVIHNPRMK